MEKKIIFHLDDDPDQLTLLKLISKEYLNMEYHGFKSCEEFLTTLKTSQPDLCIIDLNLEEGPGSGFAIIKAIKSKYELPVQIVVLSRRGDVKDITYALDLGIEDYVIKPIDPVLFSDKVKSILDDSFKSKFPIKKLKKNFEGFLHTQVKPIKADEIYLYFESDLFFLKHNTIEITHEKLEEIFQENKMIFNIHECVLNDSNGKYTLKLIKRGADDQYFDALTKYLTING